MMLRLRVELADRPGSLAELTRALTACRGDIVQITVMQRRQDVAVDDIWMSVRSTDEIDAIGHAFDNVTDMRLVGLRVGAVPVDFDAQLDFLAYLFAAPQRGVEAFVEMLPAVADADWAAIQAADGTLIYDSGDAGARRAAGHDDEVAELRLLEGATLVVGRSASMAWHPAEIRRIASVLELSALLIKSAALSVRQPATTLTGWLVTDSALVIA